MKLAIFKTKCMSRKAVKEDFDPEILASNFCYFSRNIALLHSYKYFWLLALKV